MARLRIVKACRPRAGSRGANVRAVIRGGRRSACHSASRRNGFARNRNRVVAHGRRARISPHNDLENVSGHSTPPRPRRASGAFVQSSTLKLGGHDMKRFFLASTIVATWASLGPQSGRTRAAAERRGSALVLHRPYRAVAAEHADPERDAEVRLLQRHRHHQQAGQHARPRSFHLRDRVCAQSARHLARPLRDDGRRRHRRQLNADPHGSAGVELGQGFAVAAD